MRFSAFVAAVITATGLLLSASAHGQTLQPPFDNSYSYIDLGTPNGVPAALGGLFVRADDPNFLLIGGAANSLIAKIYKIGVVRDGEGHITSFARRNATVVADAPGSVSGGIDGGLALGPGGVLFYTTYPSNQIGQIKPGSTGPDLIIDAGPLGFLSSLGTLAFVPPGFPGAGQLRVASYSQSTWYSATLTPDGSGTYTISNATNPINIGGGPEGILFVEAGNPNFAVNSVLISKYGNGWITAFDLDANSNPIVATERVFMIGVSGAEGAARDPVTGDYLFSTFTGGNRVLVVRGFTVACPADLDGDGIVGAADLAILLGDWNSTTSTADLDASGIVNAADLAVLLGAWGPCD